jgi:N-acyl amino acid synthase FeeM
VQPELDAGKVIIESSYVVADERFARVHPELPYATLRPCMLAARYFAADTILATARTEHRAFYQRAFDCTLICEPRPHPLLAKRFGLMKVYYPSQADQLSARYPFFRSPLAERRLLFERPSISAQLEASRLAV